MTGFRVARGGAQELYGMTPDLTALGKSNRRRPCRWARSGVEPKSWTSFRRTVRFTRQELYPAIRSHWPRAWRSCASWSGSMAGVCSKNSARNLKRRCRQPSTNYSFRSPFIASVRCFACFSPRAPSPTSRPQTKQSRHVRPAIFVIAWITAFISRLHNSKTGFLSTAHTAEDIERTATVTREALVEAVRG